MTDRPMSRPGLTSRSTCARSLALSIRRSWPKCTTPTGSADSSASTDARVAAAVLAASSPARVWFFRATSRRSTSSSSVRRRMATRATASAIARPMTAMRSALSTPPASHTPMTRREGRPTDDAQRLAQASVVTASSRPAQAPVDHRPANRSQNGGKEVDPEIGEIARDDRRSDRSGGVHRGPAHGTADKRADRHHFPDRQRRRRPHCPHIGGDGSDREHQEERERDLPRRTTVQSSLDGYPPSTTPDPKRDAQGESPRRSRLEPGRSSRSPRATRPDGGRRRSRSRPPG